MGAFGDLSRINTNLQAMTSLQQLQKTNSQLGNRQMRLATGSRINRAEDDSASYSIATKLQAKVRSQAQALANVGDAKSMLTVAEGSLSSVMDILQTMKEKTVQAANDTMGADERTAIKTQLDALTQEIHSALTGSEFNSTSLFTSTALSFQVNASSADTFSITIGSLSTGSASLNISGMTVNSASTAKTSIGKVDAAIKLVSDKMTSLGDSQKRLSFKQENLSTSMNNYEAARSRIADADFAKEQMEIVKLQILQQTGTASLAQANSAPQSVLSLIG